MQSAPDRDFVLPPVLDANAALAAAPALQDMLVGEMLLRLDGTQVARVTTPGVHFLVAARAQAEALGARMALAASPALLQALEILGLASVFQLQNEEGS